jgi:hypothetical protein
MAAAGGLDMGYDYGSFSKAGPRLLKPAMEKLQFKQLSGVAFARDRGQWIDGIMLHQSAYGRGDFCVDVGIDVPALDDLRMTAPADRHFGLLIWGRLGPDGVDDESWFPASDKVELEASMREVESYLPAAEAWYRKFLSLEDIVAEYLTRSDLTHVEENEHLSTVAITNYGLLLQLAGHLSESRRWLKIARAQWAFVVRENLRRFDKRKPGKEALSFHQSHLERLRAVEAVLDRTA